MSHGKLRAEKNCLNCGHHVEEKFCPHCGQENIETRQPFYYLFTHFFEDLTHYDGQFWGTIKNLLFKPGKLTTTYLEGKRQSFVPPVKLYIFISFVTFLIVAFSAPSVGKDHSDQKDKKEHVNAYISRDLIMKAATKDGDLSKEDSVKLANYLKDVPNNPQTDSINKGDEAFAKEGKFMKSGNIFNSNNLKEYDSVQVAKNSTIAKIFRPFAKKAFELKEEGVSNKDVINGFIMTFMHTLPKALFLYLPFFAFLLWIFHNKKRWWYFDHGVFTLHYFSFLLFVTIVIMLLSSITNIAFLGVVIDIFMTLLIIYALIYFFIAHYKVYRTHPLITIFTGGALFLINGIAFMILLVILVGFSFLMIH